MDATFWNQRYKEKEFAYGHEANEFLREELIKLKPGKILFAAEGEGRNAVFAAEKGWEVVAFDQSEEGKHKAEQLARERKVDLQYEVGDAMELEWPKSGFDAVVLIYSHMPPLVRQHFHGKIQEILKTNGIVIMEGFSLNNLEYVAKNPKVGGPKNPEFLFSKTMVETEFPGIEILYLEEKVIELKEGNYHNGTGSVIRFIGKKS
jgi:2-polyprenyl-3-methyl-5-hydroxy-6-metoxy-1,4-benzoquinol methylase